MCSPHYEHVLEHGAYDGENLGAFRGGPSGGFLTALAAAAPEPGMWEIMVSNPVYPPPPHLILG